jgi:hypothetical protein
MYGTAEFRGVDDEMARPWPQRSSIRTVARLEEIPGAGRSAAASTPVGQVVEYANQYATYMLCGERHCIAIVPVEEMQEFFGQQARSWVHQDVEVIGAIDTVPLADPLTRVNAPTGFLVWSIAEHPGDAPRRKPTRASSLEALVTSPDATAGRTITVSGTFRGSNLFEDLPPETRRSPGDWVLKDGPFSIWVIGKPPRGSGWSLDPASRSDCAWRLEVKGRVERQGDYIYLRAQSVTLTGRGKDEAPDRQR